MEIHGSSHTVYYTTNVFINEDTTIREVNDWRKRLIAIAEQIPSKADNLKPLIQFLVATMAPAKIYLLQQKNVAPLATTPIKGAESLVTAAAKGAVNPETIVTDVITPGSAVAVTYINLLIVMQGSRDDKRGNHGVDSGNFDESYKKYSGDYNEAAAEPVPVSVLEMPYLKGQRIFCSFHPEAVVMKGLQNGHVFYSLNCIPENLVYDNETVDYPITAPEILEELKQQIVEKFLPAFEKALDFHESAAYLYENENQESPVIPFLLHQAVELTYRAVLQGLQNCLNDSGNKTRHPIMTHTIRILQKLACCCAPQLNIVFPDNTGEEKRLLDLLERAYSDARYENGYAIPQDDLSKLFDRVIRLQEMAKSLVKEKTE